MAECELLKLCPFFRDELTYLPQTAEQMKQTYCLGEKAQCARHMVVSGGIIPPRDLFPNQTDRVAKILGRPDPPSLLDDFAP